MSTPPPPYGGDPNQPPPPYGGDPNHPPPPYGGDPNHPYGQQPPPPPSYNPPPPSDPYGGGGGYQPQEPPPPMYSTPMAPYGAAPAPMGATSQNNTLALVSMIVGIASLVICCAGVPAGIAALIMGFIARNQIQQSGGTQGGGGFALTGIICGGAAILVSIIAYVIYFVDIAASGNFNG